MNTILEKLHRIDRLKFFQRIVLVLFSLLLLQLFRITIIDGKKYRHLADSRRVKEVMITAQRGNIRDRNGIILAGNRPVFTLQLRKDELEKVKKEEKNANFLKLVRYIEEDGVDYLDDFPLEINTFIYKNDQILIDKDPMDSVVKALEDPIILSELLDKKFISSYKGHFSYSISKDFLHSLGLLDKDSPILWENYHNISYKDPIKASEFKNTHGLGRESSAREDLIHLLISNPTSIKEVLNHPIARKQAYEVLKAHNKIEDISLREFGNIYLDNYTKQKNILRNMDPQIRMNSSAQEDFYRLLRKYSLENLLLSKKEKDRRDSNLKLAVLAMQKNKVGQNVSLEKKNGQEHVVFPDGKNAFSYLLKELNKDLVLETFLSMEDMRSLAQKQLIKDGINPGISVGKGKYQYTQLKNAQDLFARYSVKVSEGNKALFEAICRKHAINPKLSIYEKRAILNIYNSVEKQGNYAYIPVNYAYEVSNETVAKIEENLPPNQGIEISIEPIRSYPLGKSSSHILGYIGKIAMDKEIKKYIEGLSYDRNTLIGKTGIEEVEEENLKGVNGYRKVTVDSLGNTTDIIEEKAPIPGRDVQLSIDIDLQQKAEESLEKCLEEIRAGGTFTSPWGNYNYITSKDKGRPYNQATSGAVVVLDVKNGGVLAMANYPQFDPNLFAKGITPMAWESLKPLHENDPLAPRPLYNISMQTAIQPGSIFKMVTGLAGLEKGLDPKLKIQDGGFVDLGGHRFGCWLWNQKREVHGQEDLANAIKDSCNYYFYSLALGKDQKTGKEVGITLGAQDISNMAKKFGLGEKTGLEINIPQEVKGTRPDPTTKEKLLKSLLSRHLDANIKDYYIGKEPLTDKKEKDIKDKILASLDSKEEMSRQEAYSFLENLEINPEAYAKKEKMQFVDVLKYTYIDQAKWKLADTLNVTIGQGSNSYTPVQLARYTMALANGGNLYDLHLIDKVVDPSKKSPIKSSKIANNLVEISDPKYYGNIKEGMKLVAKSGLNKNLFENFPIEVAMKTGSAERSGINPYTKDTYDSFAWEVAFAPADKPEIAICVVLFQGGTGSNAGPILQSVLAEYFGLNKEYKEESIPIETSIEF